MNAIKRPTLRQARLAATRGHVLEAAQRLFLKRGYQRTTVDAVAEEAGVAVQTIYNCVGNKAALLTGVFETAVSGPEAPRPVPSFMRERVEFEADPRGVVRHLAAWFVEVHARMAPLWKMIDDAAGQDAEVAEFARKRAHRRLKNYREAAEGLQQRGGLRAGLGLEEAAAVIWSLGHPQVYRTLVLEQRWSAQRYEAWVASSLEFALLLPPGH